MAAHRTDQERIDAATLEIKNPNVVGSGYIQHPPQKPFAAPLQMQPPTVAHFEFPNEYSKYREHTRQNGAQGPPRRSHDQRSQGYANANGQTHNGSAPYGGSSSQQNSYRQSYSAQGRGAQHQAGAGSMPALGRGRGATGVAANQAQARPAAVPVVPRRAPAQAGPPQHQHASSAAQLAPRAAPQRSGAPSAVPQRQPHVPAAPTSQSAQMPNEQSTAPLSQAVGQMTLTDLAPSKATAHAQPADTDDDEHDKAMSKSQAKRLRKKKREGKV